MKTLSLNILDIVQNSIRAEAGTITIGIEESAATDLYTIKVTDNGKGIPAGIVDSVTDPFVTTRTRRRMGLGLALLKFHACMAEGDLKITSTEGEGTEVTATFRYGHIDRQPLGDIAGVMMILVGGNPGREFIYSHTTDRGSYIFSTREIREVLECEILSGASLLNDLREMIDSNLKEIQASGLQDEKVIKVLGLKKEIE